MKLKLLQHPLVHTQCVIPENIHTFHTEEIFSMTPSLIPLEIPIKLHTLFKFFWLYIIPHFPGNSNPLCGGSMDILLELLNVLYNNVTTSELKLLLKL